MATAVYPYTQYSGIWNISSQANAKALGTWPVMGPHLYSWGQNTGGQLGLGNTTNYSSPKQVGVLATWKSNSLTGSGSVAAIKTDGTLWAWGNNSYGELGTGNTTNYSSPKQVGALTNWSQTASGYGHVLAVKTDGTLWSWGWGNFGGLGLGNTTSYSSPKQIGALTSWLKVSAGYQSSLALKTNGTLWSWGNNGQGQLGLGNANNYYSPAQIGALTTWSAIAMGFAHALARKTDGTLWSWGDNIGGALGLGNKTYYSSPKQVGVLTTWNTPSAGLGDSFCTTTSNALWSWGRNDTGQLGLGTSSGTYANLSPLQVGALTTWTSVSTGMYTTSTFALKTDGTIWSWGNGGNGALGLGNTTNYSSPKQVGALTTWTAITNNGISGTSIGVVSTL